MLFVSSTKGRALCHVMGTWGPGSRSNITQAQPAPVSSRPVSRPSF